MPDTAPPTFTAAATRRRRVRWDVLLPSLLLALLALLALFVLLALSPAAFVAADPQRCDLSRSLEPPSAAHPFGLSLFGCDYLAETV